MNFKKIVGGHTSPSLFQLFFDSQHASIEENNFASLEIESLCLALQESEVVELNT